MMPGIPSTGVVGVPNQRSRAGTIGPTFRRQEYVAYRRRLHRCLDVFAQILDRFQFDEDRPMTGLELEICLVDRDGQPAMRNQDLLALLAEGDLSGVFQEELGRFNIEANIPPRLIGGTGLHDCEAYLRTTLNQAQTRAESLGIGLVAIGILPTITPDHTVLANVSSNPRYSTLNSQILTALGDDVSIDIQGRGERLQVRTESIMPEAANTSLQLHLQVTPATFAAYWNASQAIAGVQVAVGANSPFLFGTRLWDETRVILFEQSTDTRPEEQRNQGVRPRVWFGERWITSVFDLFEENIRYFPPLLPIAYPEDPDEAIEAGRVPYLGELRLHNGTVYRWNRPVYDVADGRPHLRVENRVLAAGPTVVDMLANAAFYFGLVRTLATANRPVWSQLTFDAARRNFYEACKYGLSATQEWPRLGELAATDLVLEKLLPAAAEGLAAYGVDATVRDRLLGIIERRCDTGRNGAVWQTRTVAALEERGMNRPAALREMLRRYVSHMHTNEPVHTWPID
jgi:gamma-glutamyl:cysteine ligase YbdK (ATP-grasp superfamily)